jgi:hypothetical protein
MAEIELRRQRKLMLLLLTRGSDEDLQVVLGSLHFVQQPGVDFVKLFRPKSTDKT